MARPMARFVVGMVAVTTAVGVQLAAAALVAGLAGITGITGITGRGLQRNTVDRQAHNGPVRFLVDAFHLSADTATIQTAGRTIVIAPPAVHIDGRTVAPPRAGRPVAARRGRASDDHPGGRRADAWPMPAPGPGILAGGGTG